MTSYYVAFMFLFSLAFQQAVESPQSAPRPACQPTQKCVKAGAANIIFKSTDGGQTWQDISAGLPEQVQADDFVEKDNELYLRTKNGIYHSTLTATAPFWQKENSPAGRCTIAFDKPGHYVESDGVRLATSQNGIIRSTDKGETWDSVISEGGVGIAVERINGGFAAISYNTQSKTRRVRTSYDGGNTWQSIDAGLPPSLSISSIIEVGNNFFCGHPDGIFRSSDKGKTWKLVVPSIDDKVFNLSVSGNVVYAVLRNGGC